MSTSSLVLRGIAVGLGYLSIPFFFLLFSQISVCAGSSSEYCARNGSFACSIFYANFPYLLFAPLLLLLGPVVILAGVARLLLKETETAVDVAARVLGIIAVVLHAYMWIVSPSCGIK